MNGFQEVRNTLQTLERKLAHENEQQAARIAEIGKQLAGKTREHEQLQAKFDQEHREKEKLKQQLEDFESEFVKNTSNVASRIATLEAEQEIIARRDRESRNELDRLRHMKNGKQ